MFFRKKKRNTDVTELFLNGGIPAAAKDAAAGTDGNPQGMDALAILESRGIKTELIPASMLPSIASSLAMNTSETNEQAKIKVDCTACNRQVAYGKGKCMYCGKPLELPVSASAPKLTASTAAAEASAGEADKPAASGGIDFDLGSSL